MGTTLASLAGVRGMRTIHSFHGQETIMAITESSTSATTPILGGSSAGGPGPEVMAADTLEGDPVVNESGETLGKIRDIMIDVPSGRVAYAVLSVGGLMGMGNKLFAIPWAALVLDA